MCASSLARNIRFYFRWISSELNSGDFGSRRYDPFYDPSKTLVDRLAQNLFLKSICMVNRRSRILLTQRSSQTQKKAQEPRSSRTRVLTRKTTLKIRTTRSPLLSLEKFLETAKGDRNVGGAGDDEEEPDSSDSDNDQHFDRMPEARSFENKGERGSESFSTR